MGKKSRLKRERRSGATNVAAIIRERAGKKTQVDTAFQRRTSELTQLFSRYSAEEVLIALGISDLWIPNISSQAKHIFAFGIVASMEPKRFTGSIALESYAAFSSFLAEVYKLMPTFPMLEDYIPEADWGQIRSETGGVRTSVFYGGCLERVPDFIDALRLLHPEAGQDLALAIELQHLVIASIRSDLTGTAEAISPGHIEIPSEDFWLACRAALTAACELAARRYRGLSGALVEDLGAFRAPITSFGDALMEGAALPMLLIRVKAKFFPVSLRNAASTVAEFWASKNSKPNAIEQLESNERVGRFIAQRIDDRSVVVGPLRFVVRGRKGLRYHFAAVVKTSNKIYLIALVPPKEMHILPQMDNELRELLTSGEDWALLREGTNLAVQLMNGEGALPGLEQIQILAVLSSVATGFTHLRLPNTRARVLWLADFVTIFDSLTEADELDRFWAYADANESAIWGISGPADLFASFKDSHALLVDGATKPTMIALDPHWGSNWRFNGLVEFWRRAPAIFPDGSRTWVVEERGDGIQRLTAKGAPALAWSTEIGSCTVQAVFRLFDQDLDLHNGNLLELFVHCLIDSMAQRSALIRHVHTFQRTGLVVICRANAETLALDGSDEITLARGDQPLLSGWRSLSCSGGGVLTLSVDVNLARLRVRLENPIDASFEAECAIAFIAGLTALETGRQDDELVIGLRKTGERKPRFTLMRVNRTIDVPDFCTPTVPGPEHFKVARRDLAIALKENGVAAPARYELEPAKRIIDAARDAIRRKVHDQIAAFARDPLLQFCIEQHDQLTAQYQREVYRLRQSLSHEVSFDRAQRSAELHEKFVSEARNYRYLLECCLSSPRSGTAPANPDQIVLLVALIDWLFVLYGASDVLHNAIDVAGIELDHSFVPQVFYASAHGEEFSREMAEFRLGINLAKEDEVIAAQEFREHLPAVNQAFVADVGFSLSSMVGVLLTLARWHSVGGDTNLRFIYTAQKSTIVSKLMEHVDDLSEAEATKVLEFITLDPKGVRRLIGRIHDEADVPVWEHNKRSNRYVIRPLIEIGDGGLAWGAAVMERACSVWSGAIVDGYLPAEFEWPNVKEQVRKVNARLESQLEDRAFNVCSRFTPYVFRGINFRSRFPKEGFEDVGDFDVLAYWPQTNRWVSVECKYNQPPFCLKDARRLRERIFGIGSDRGQFTKIQRRAEFLKAHASRLRALLRWPEPPEDVIPSMTDVYVSRDIYWWMRNPPYDVSTHFARVDALHGWFASNGFG